MLNNKNATIDVTFMTLFLFWCTNNESFRFWKDQFQTKTCKISNSKLEPNILQLELIRDCFHENSSLPVGDAELFIRGAAPVMLQWFPILLTKFLPFKGGTQNPRPPFWTPMFTIYSFIELCCIFSVFMSFIDAYWHTYIVMPL